MKKQLFAKEIKKLTNKELFLFHNNKIKNQKNN